MQWDRAALAESCMEVSALELSPKGPMNQAEAALRMRSGE